jgi:hypothetical protein
MFEDCHFFFSALVLAVSIQQDTVVMLCPLSQVVVRDSGVEMIQVDGHVIWYVVAVGCEQGIVKV